MQERVAKAGLVAIACGALAVSGFALASRLDAFAPCRVPYRIPQAVQDSLACHMYSAIGIGFVTLRRRDDCFYSGRRDTRSPAAKRAAHA